MIRQLGTAEGSTHIDKGGVHHVVPLPSDRRFSGSAIDTSELDHILSIDPVERIAVCEPGVTIERLVAAALPHGLVPAVVPELRGITLGGMVAGCSLESMSWRYGGFHDTCESYEVITGDGRLLRVSPSESPHLFHHLHGSYGTLGILTEITCRLVPATPWVEVTYRHLHDIDTFEAELRAVCSTDDPDAPERHQFVDAIVLNPQHFVLCLGRFVDDPGPMRPSDYTGTAIYHRSVAERDHDLMATEQYLFRYDAECHWLTETVPPLTWKPVRALIGRWLLGSTNLIRWSNRTAPIQRRLFRRPDIVVDIFIPGRRLRDFWQWYRHEFDFWPLWVVPYRPPEVYPWIGRHVREALGDEDLFIDLAIYGKPNRAADRDLSEALEQRLFELGGIKTLIGRNHYAEDRFWAVYDRDAYDRAKAELDPGERFPNLYDKLGRVD